MQQENLADIRHKLLIIYKHIQSMLNELRYQEKKNIISEKLSKEKVEKKTNKQTKKKTKFCIFSPIFFFLCSKK
jgi:hypothetical protein